MRQFQLILLGVVGLVALFAVTNSFFIVEQTEQAIVLKFGQPVREVSDPGLHYKIPFVESVVILSRQLLDFEPRAEEVIAADQKRLVVDTFARYRIVDPLAFYRTVGNEVIMRQRLGATISASLRRVMGTLVLPKLLSPERSAIMGRIRDDVAAEARSFGIDVVDVRIRRADLPTENSEAIYSRMKSERDREAKQYRAEGAEQAQAITAKADRDVTVIRADANRDAQLLRGQGDAESTKIYADAFGQDPEFYAFYRSLQAYRTALAGGTTMVLSPDSDFFHYLLKKPVPAKP
jgi:membrane protease subunit HflC